MTSDSLQFAVFKKDLQEVTRLVEAGASLSVADSQGRTALDAALSMVPVFGTDSKANKIVAYLTDQYRKLPPEKISVALAAQIGHIEAVKRHLADRPPKSPRSEPYLKALLKAVQSGQTEVVSLLFEAGIDPSAATDEQLNLLMVAARSGHDAIVEQLLEKGLPIEGEISTGRDKGVTPLILAACHNKLSTVKLLIERGANILASDALGSTALAYAQRNGCKRVVTFLEKIYEKQGTSSAISLHDAARDGFPDRVKELLDQRASVDSLDALNQTPLMLAAQCGHFEIVELLCKRGANLQLMGGQRFTMWDYAITPHDTAPRIIRCLVDHGLDPNQLTATTLPPIMLAIQHSASKNAESLLKTLLDCGADPHATFSYSLTPEMQKSADALKAAGSKLANKIGGTYDALQYAKHIRNNKAYDFLSNYLQVKGDAYDTLRAELKGLRVKADDAFLTEGRRVGEILNAKPQEWTRRKGVLHYFASLTKRLAEYYGEKPPAEGVDPDDVVHTYLKRFQDELRSKGYVLVYADLNFQDKPLARLLLFPAAEPLLPVIACGTNGDNHGYSTREVVNWCVKKRETCPLTVLGMGFDFLSLHFESPVRDIDALVKDLAEFCPDSEYAVNPASAKSHLERTGNCFLWWD